MRTRGYGGSSKPSWLLIKHKDEWAGPVDITEFAPLSVKTPEADLADILASDTPDIWHSNPPAKTGDTGKLYQRIIATALELRAHKHADAPTRLMSAAAAAAKLDGLGKTDDAPAAKTKRAARTPRKSATPQKAATPRGHAPKAAAARAPRAAKATSRAGRSSRAKAPRD